jgi:hypothetical protein
MLLEYVETYVDEDDADTSMWEVDLTDEELQQIETMLSEGHGYGSWDEESDVTDDEGNFVFRGKKYGPGNNLCDVLNDVGKRVAPDCSVSFYVY